MKLFAGKMKGALGAFFCFCALQGRAQTGFDAGRDAAGAAAPVAGRQRPSCRVRVRELGGPRDWTAGVPPHPARSSRPTCGRRSRREKGWVALTATLAPRWATLLGVNRSDSASARPAGEPTGCGRIDAESQESPAHSRRIGIACRRIADDDGRMTIGSR